MAMQRASGSNGIAWQRGYLLDKWPISLWDVSQHQNILHGVDAQIWPWRKSGG